MSAVVSGRRSPRLQVMFLEVLVNQLLSRKPEKKCYISLTSLSSLCAAALARGLERPLRL